MAHIDEGGDDRAASVDLNIVPFIDLMSVLIIFLLITAVWTQVSMIQIGSSIYGKKTPQEPAEPPPKAEIPFRLDVKPFGYRVVVGKQSVTVDKTGGDYDDAKLLEELEKIKELYPEKVDAVITIDDELAYNSLIRGMDALLTAGFPQISVATGGVR